MKRFEFSRVLVVAIVLLALSGCVSRYGIARGMGALPPGYGVTDELAIAACETIEAFLAEVAEYAAAIESGEGQKFPEVGDTACTVLAKVGLPDEWTSNDVLGFPDQDHWRWWSNDPDRGLRTHFVTISIIDGVMVATYVVW